VRGTLPGLLIAAGIVVVDQITKVIAENQLDSPVTLIDGFLRFRLTRNDGAAFSMFQGGGQVVAIIALGITSEKMSIGTFTSTGPGWPLSAR